MLKRFLFLIIILLAFLSQQAIGQNLSENSKVYLLTCGPGKQLYSTFGHTAIFINDPKLGLNKVYNYGTFDFDTPNFYLKFCQGELDYFLNVTTLNQFVYMYEREGREVMYQELNLTLLERDSLYQYLTENAKPDNKFYRYRFIGDNCSTRPRDAVEAVLGDRLQYAYNLKESRSYRNYLDDYLTNHPWSDLGIDLALGNPLDQTPNYRELMFLPDYLYRAFDDASIMRGSRKEPLVKSEGIFIEANAVTHSKESITWIFWSMMVVAFIFSLFFQPKRLKWFDIILFVSVGIIGVLLALLWFATSHIETKLNFNLLWALPTWFIGAFLLIRNRSNSLFFKIHAVWMFILVLMWFAIPQELHPAVIPVMLTLAIRSWAWQKQRHKELKSEAV